MVELETGRLVLRRLTLDDAHFILELVAHPTFVANIGNRGVRDLPTAKHYLEQGPFASYAAHGFGLWHVARKSDGASIGMCGLLKRDHLPDADIGFALLPAYRSQGFAHEAAAAVLAHARTRYGLGRVLAVVSPGNCASIRVLEKTGMRLRGLQAWPGDSEVRLYETTS